MTAPDERASDCLRESLRELADAAQPADLYDGAVRRSRAIGRREATAGTAAALVALAVLASGLWRMPGRHPNGAPPPVAAGGAVATPPGPPPTATAVPLPTLSTATQHPSGAATARHGKNRPRVVTSISLPQSRLLADLPGKVFYARPGDEPDVVRMSPSDGDTVTVLADAPSPVGISPDGDRIAFEQDGNLLVAGTDGGTPERLATGVTTTRQAPTWSPDGNRLLVHASTPAILQVATGTLTPLPEGLGNGLHFRWSGDGTKLVFATSFCGLQVAGSGDDTGVAVPVLGDRQAVDNPDGLAACLPTSVDVAGDRVTVPLQTTGATGDDGSTTADVVVDTTTGDLIPLPVAGTVVGTVFDPRGNLLVRTVNGGIWRLSLFAPDGTLLVQATEPAALKDLDLLTYTR
jgi:TolB protein